MEHSLDFWTRSASRNLARLTPADIRRTARALRACAGTPWPDKRLRKPWPKGTIRKAIPHGHVLSDAELQRVPVLAELTKSVREGMRLTIVCWSDGRVLITAAPRSSGRPPTWWVRDGWCATEFVSKHEREAA